jgi:hypothetical protein
MSHFIWFERWCRCCVPWEAPTNTAAVRTVQSWPPMLTLKAFTALVVTWCLLAVAAIVAASTRRFEGWYMYLLVGAVFVGLVIVVAIALTP